MIHPNHSTDKCQYPFGNLEFYCFNIVKICLTLEFLILSSIISDSNTFVVLVIIWYEDYMYAHTDKEFEKDNNDNDDDNKNKNNGITMIDNNNNNNN